MVSSNRRWEAWKKGDERTLDGERKGSPYTLERNCILRFSTLGVGIAKNSLAIKKRRERERGEEKGSRKTDRGERLRKQSQSNAIEIAGNSSSRIRSLDKGEREHRGGWEREKGKGRASENRCVPASDFEREDRRTKKRKVTKGWFTVEKDILSISCVDRELALNHVLRSFLREREEENDYYIHNILTK